MFLSVQCFSNILWQTNHQSVSSPQNVLKPPKINSEIRKPWGDSLQHFKDILWEFRHGCNPPGLPQIERQSEKLMCLDNHSPPTVAAKPGYDLKMGPKGCHDSTYQVRNPNNSLGFLGWYIKSCSSATELLRLKCSRLWKRISYFSSFEHVFNVLILNSELWSLWTKCWVLS